MITIYITLIQFPTFNRMHSATIIQKTWRSYILRKALVNISLDNWRWRGGGAIISLYIYQKKRKVSATIIQSVWRRYGVFDPARVVDGSRAGLPSRLPWEKFILTPRFKAYRDFCYAICIQNAFRTYYRQKKLHTQMVK